MTTKVEVFDPPMCCSTGVCGPSVNPALPRFTADLKWLQVHGVAVARHNLAQQPMAFAGNAVVQEAMGHDAECLPLVLVGGKTVARRTYPSREQLAAAVCDAMHDHDETPSNELAAAAMQQNRQMDRTAVAPPSCGCSERKGTRCW